MLLSELRATQRDADRIIASSVSLPTRPDTWTARIDAVVLHPVGGLLILALILFVMFQAVFAWAAPLMELLSSSFGALGQTDDEQWPSLSYLRRDYRSVVAVAHVRAREAEIVNRIGGYEDWRIVCEIIEPFKGKLRRGEQLEFYHGAEAGFRKELFLGDKIIFLVRNFHEQDKKWVYAVLENSTLPYTEDRARKLRIIARSNKRKRHSIRRA